jgi:hypothetical protein
MFRNEKRELKDPFIAVHREFNVGVFSRDARALALTHRTRRSGLSRDALASNLHAPQPEHRG